MIGTPIGGQSVSQVCERIGEGPELTSTAGAYNFPVFDDAQCGHGPGLSGFKGLLSNSDSANSKGPKWDLASAYPASGINSNSGKAIESAANTNTSNRDTGTDSTIVTTTRFKTRYIKLPTTTKQSVSAEATISAERTGVVREVPTIKKPETKPSQQAAVSSAVNPKLPVIQKTDALSQSAIAELPVAKVEPVAKVTAPAKAKVISTTDASANVVKPEIAVPSQESKVVVEAITPNPEADVAVLKVPTSNSLSVPSSVRASSRNFDYLSVLPVNYDFGGAGVQVAGSITPVDQLRVIARAGVADTYQEVFVGASYVITPNNATRVSVALTGGVEFGRFSFEGQNIETSASETGVFARAESRFVVSRRFELQGGVGFSSFFDGDPHAFGGASYHITRKLDLTSEFELGDNDSIGLGIRYFY